VENAATIPPFRAAWLENSRSLVEFLLAVASWWDGENERENGENAKTGTHAKTSRGIRRGASPIQCASAEPRRPQATRLDSEIASKPPRSATARSTSFSIARDKTPVTDARAGHKKLCQNLRNSLKNKARMGFWQS